MIYGTLSYLFVDGRVLMVKKFERENDPNSGFFTLPGGKLKHSEKSCLEGRTNGAIRETREETGITLLNPKLNGIILFDNSERIFSNWKNPSDYLVYLFFANRCEGRIKYKSKEGRIFFVPESEICNLPKNPGDDMMYNWIKSRKPFFGVIKHKGRNLDKKETFVNYL